MSANTKKEDKLKDLYHGRKIKIDRLKLLEKYSGKSVLDVGCGNGAYVLHLKDKKDMKGVDYLQFDTWNEAPELFSVASAEDLSKFADNSFDTVCSFELLEHMKDPAKVLKELHRVCRKNVILTVPNCAITKGMKSSSFLYYHWIDPTHVQFFNKQSLKALVKKCGFQVEYSGFINRVNFLPLFKELFGWENKSSSSIVVKILNLVIRLLTKKKYYITLAVVANKV